MFSDYQKKKQFSMSKSNRSCKLKQQSFDYIARIFHYKEFPAELALRETLCVDYCALLQTVTWCSGPG